MPAARGCQLQCQWVILVSLPQSQGAPVPLQSPTQGAGAGHKLKRKEHTEQDGGQESCCEHQRGCFPLRLLLYLGLCHWGMKCSGLERHPLTACLYGMVVTPWTPTTAMLNLDWLSRIFSERRKCNCHGLFLNLRDRWSSV